MGELQVIYPQLPPLILFAAVVAPSSGGGPGRDKPHLPTISISAGTRPLAFDATPASQGSSSSRLPAPWKKGEDGD